MNRESRKNAQYI